MPCQARDAAKDANAKHIRLACVYTENTGKRFLCELPLDCF